MHKWSLAGAGLLLAMLGGCVPRAEAPALAPPPPTPEPTPPAPAPPPPPPPADWRDAPLSEGDWSYRSEGSTTLAAFGADGAPLFVMRCGTGRQLMLARLGASGRSIAIRTTFGERNLPATAHMSEAVATLAASDPLLDQIAFSRGRFLVQTEGAAPLILPAWPETARVIEDCRG